MKTDRLLVWAVRISWPLLGGVWGVMAGFGGYHVITKNADSFGTMFAHGFFIAAAIIGLFVGIACGVLVGGLTEKLLRYLGVRTAHALCAATVVNALVIWQLIGMVQTNYPGFRPPVNKSNAAKESSTYKLRTDNPCAQPPPPANRITAQGQVLPWDSGDTLFNSDKISMVSPEFPGDKISMVSPEFPGKYGVPGIS